MPNHYHPDYYDLFHDDHGGDIFFYRKLASERGGPVLELGAGTGRVALPLARAGLEVWALDMSEPLLGVFRKRLEREPRDVRARVTILSGDMRDFRLGRRFAMIQIPYRAFSHNRSRADQLACLRCCMAHLEPGGLLALNTFHPSLTDMTQGHGPHAGRWRWVDERELDDGGWVVLSEAVLFDNADQLFSSRLRYERYDRSGRMVRVDMERLDMAYLFPGDIRELMAAAGFVDLRIHGDFDGRPLTADGQEMVIQASRPS